jgi:predicted acetylornithine/succinylornithine family transaminase
MTENWAELEQRYYLGKTKRLPVTFVRGEGVRVWDEDGREYLDFLAGIAAVSLGHGHPVLLAAIQQQAKELMLISNYYYTIPQIKLARLLCENTCFDKVFFCNSGAEAVEGCIKLARKWGKEKRDGAYEIIVADGAFHGRTLATVTAGSTEKYRAPFTPLPEGFVRVPFNDADAVRRATTGRTAAVMLEPIQGEAGVVVPDDDYLRKVRAWCDEVHILLVLDEVQTGVGRIGALFAHQDYGVEPDIMAVAKGLGGGFPIGAFLSKEHCAVFGPGEHGTTFGGNSLATAAGHAVLKFVIDEDVSGQVARKGEYLERRLRSLADRRSMVTEIRGKGLLWAIELDRAAADQAVKMCLSEGLLANNVRPTALRLVPPLTVTEEELDRAIEIVDRVLSKIEAETPK